MNVAHGYQEAQNRLVDAEWVRKQYEVAWKGALCFASRNPGVEVFQDSNTLLGKIALAAHVDWGRLTSKPEVTELLPDCDSPRTSCVTLQTARHIFVRKSRWASPPEPQDAVLLRFGAKKYSMPKNSN